MLLFILSVIFLLFKAFGYDIIQCWSAYVIAVIIEMFVEAFICAVMELTYSDYQVDKIDNKKTKAK